MGWRMAGGGVGFTLERVWKGLSKQAHLSQDLADEQEPAF